MHKRIAWIKDAQPIEQGKSAPPSFITLPHPQSGSHVQYLFRPNDQKPLCQVQAIESNGFKSWFHGNSVISDGEMLLVTPIDPLFLLLPILHARHAMLLRDAQTKDAPQTVPWERLEDILYDPSAPNLIHLSQLPHIASQLGHLADTQDLGENGVLLRFNPQKSLAFLKAKVTHLLNNVDASVLAGLAYRSWDKSNMHLIADQKTQMAISIMASHLNTTWLDKLVDAFADGTLMKSQPNSQNQENQSEVGNYQSPAAFKRSNSSSSQKEADVKAPAVPSFVTETNRAGQSDESAETQIKCTCTFSKGFTRDEESLLLFYRQEIEDACSTKDVRIFME